MARNTRIFSDIDLNFLPHPVSGDISKKYDEYAIKQSIKNLILTQNYERPFHSEIGSQIKGLLFELPTSMTSSIVKRQIFDVIGNYEPRANILDVTVGLSPDNNGIYCTIVFTILNTSTPISVDLFLERTR